MSRERGQLPLAATDREDNVSISEKVPTVSDSEPALEALRDVYANLVERLHSPSVIEHLYSGRLLSKVEYDLAKSKESNYDKNTEVLGALMRSGPVEVVKFCQVLFERNQHNCGRILLEALNKRGVDVSSVVIPSQTPPAVRSTSPKYNIEMEDLNDAFITLVRETETAGKKVEGLKTICIQLLNEVAGNKASTTTKRNVQEDINALQKCDGDYVHYLQPYWDSLDCNLLHRLIRQLKKPELMSDWEKYRTQVKEACTSTLEECRRSLLQGRNLPPNQISVGFQTTQPPNDVTVQKMLNLKDFLIKRMGLEEADFAGFANSDVTLFFTVSRSRLPFLVRMCALHHRSLQDFSITVVFVPGEFIYDVITDQEFPYPEATSQRSEPVLQLKDLREELLHQFEQLQASNVLQGQISTLKGTLCKDHLDTIEKAVEGYQKVAAFLEDSGLLEGKLSLSIDLCQLAIEKKAEVDWMLQVLQAKQKELESNERSSQILKGKRHKTIPKAAQEKKGSKINLTEDDTDTDSELSPSDFGGVPQEGKGHKAVLKAASEKKRPEINLIEDDADADSEVSPSDIEGVPREKSLQLSGGGTTECEDELFALAYEDGVKDKYMCHVYEKSERNWTTNSYGSKWRYTTAQLHMVITYSTSHWSQIVRKYCMPDGEDWKLRTVIKNFTVEGDVITANIPESSGPTWSCAIDGIDKVSTSFLDFPKRSPLEKDGPKLLEQAVKTSLYPPNIDLIASSDVHGRDEYNRSRFICLEIAGSTPGIQIPVHIMDQVEPGMRERQKVSKPDSDRKTHEEESSSDGVSSSSVQEGDYPYLVRERDFLSPLYETGKRLSYPLFETHSQFSPSVQESRMTKAVTILSPSSKEKDQQAN